MNRRRFLTTVSAALPLSVAGCLGNGNEDEPSTTSPPASDSPDNPDDPTTAGPTTSGPMSVGDKLSLGDDRALGVVGADATAFVVTRSGTDYQVHADNTTRHVLVTVDADAIDDHESFVAENVAFTINGEETFTDPVFPLGGGSNRFAAAYAVPNDLTAYTGSVNLDTGDTSATWEFDARDIESITMDVDFGVLSVSAPDAVAAEADFGVDLEVENAGDALGFVTLVEGTAGAPTRASFDIPAGETKTVTVEATAPAADGNSEFDVTLDWGADTTSKTIQFEQ